MDLLDGNSLYRHPQNAELRDAGGGVVELAGS